MRYNSQQQQQAAQVRQQTGFSDQWLALMAEHPQVTLQRLMETKDANVE